MNECYCCGLSEGSPYGCDCEVYQCADCRKCATCCKCCEDDDL